MLNSSATALNADQYVPLLAERYPYFTNKSAIWSGVIVPLQAVTIIAAEVGPQPLEPIVWLEFSTELYILLAHLLSI